MCFQRVWILVHLRKCPLRDFLAEVISCWAQRVVQREHWLPTSKSILTLIYIMYGCQSGVKFLYSLFYLK